MIRERHEGNDAVTGDMRYDKVVVILGALNTTVRKYDWDSNEGSQREVALRPFTWNGGDSGNEAYNSTANAAPFSRISKWRLEPC